MDVEEWVEEKMEEGEPLGEIRRELSDAGWSEEDIDRVIQQARGRIGRPDPGPEPRKDGDDTGSGKDYLRPIVLFLVSAVIGFLTVAAITTFI